MEQSAKPGRRRTSESPLHSGQSDSAAKEPQKDTSVSPGGCLAGLSCAALLILVATLDWLWGDETWQWAAESWPGGAYGFAVFIGGAGPCLAALSIFCLSHTGWKSWRQHPVRTLTHTAVGAASAIALLLFAPLITNAQNSGGWARSRSAPPAWVFSHYPWLWAVGLASTVGAVVVLISVSVLHRRQRRTTASNMDS
jgi:hypothetical protein